jgi:hypothetical protein
MMKKKRVSRCQKVGNLCVRVGNIHWDVMDTDNDVPWEKVNNGLCGGKLRFM